MPRRANVEFHPSKRDENALRSEQRQITRALRKAQEWQARRDERARTMFHERGYTQRALAALLSEGAIDEGGQALTEDAVQKALQRLGPAAIPA